MKKMVMEMNNVKLLAEHLSLCSEVTRFNHEGEEAWTIAHAFRDIEEAFHTIFEEEIPKLLKIEDPDVIYKKLIDIGEELRHVQYHIKDMAFFKYLSEGDT